MSFNYWSVCSGIEAATVAWSPLGWKARLFSEIEAFPSAVLKHHYPDVPNRGDMTKFKEWPDDAIDLLVGGTPCQSFSVAGLRAGLADPRGNLMLTYLAIAAEHRPRWLAWENVPGVLSSNGGRDFGTFLRGLGELGYGFAYRVLDAQFCRAHGLEGAVPQRRRRVFVVGYLGDWRRAAAVLFDAASLRGDPPPRREAGQGVAPTISSRPTGGGGLGTDFDLDGGLIESGRAWPAELASTLNAAFGDKQGLENQHIDSGAPLFVPHAVVGALTAKGPTANGAPEVDAGHYIAHSLRGEGFDVGNGHRHQRRSGYRDEKGLVAFQQQDSNVGDTGEIVGTLPAGNGNESGGVPCIAWSIMPQNSGKDYKARAVEVAQPVMAGGPVGGNQGGDYIQQAWAVRRLTPTECERLQGFPDGYTNVPYRGKSGAADGPRYKALGNSMAVNVMRIIGERIAMVDAIK